MTTPQTNRRSSGLSIVLVLALGILAGLVATAYGHGSGSPYPSTSGQYPYPGGEYPDHPPGGEYRDHPPGDDYPRPPGEDGPPGDDDGGHGCFEKPPGVTEAETHAIFDALKRKFEDFEHSGPPDAETIERLVREAAAEAGVTNPAAVDFVIKIILAHMPGADPPGEDGDCEGESPPVDVPGDGVPDDGFKPGFLKRIHRVKVEVDALDGRVLYGTVVRFVRLPARFADQDDDLVEVEAAVKFRPQARIFRDHERVPFGELEDADRVLVKGKVMHPDKWLTSLDGDTTVPSLYGFRAYILD